VIVALSGGVDSSVAAALLKERSFEVIGVFILGWNGTTEFPCAWQREQNDARLVARKLQIPFFTINLEKQYDAAVIQPFIASYRAGLTPNPDVLCNREIKFKALWQAVRQFEPDYLATGHYAKISQTSKLKSHNEFGIFKAADTDKDQSYFLWGIDRSMLDKIMFPLGKLSKTEVRALARKFQLPTAAKKDSQGICFVGPLKVRRFLQTQLSPKRGDAVLADGRVVAQHQGAALYTVGERLGAQSVAWSGDVPPLFVIGKDLGNNQLIVGSDAETFASQFTAKDINWLIKPRARQFVCQAKIRYRQDEGEVVVSMSKGSPQRLNVKFTTPVRAITPGQSVVFYAKDGRLLGGAVISDARSYRKLRSVKRARNRSA